MPARRAPLALALVAALAIGGRPLAAQTWREVSASRAMPGAMGDLRVRVHYDVGTFRLSRAAGPVLYDVRLRYDDDKFDPVRRFDPTTNTLTVGVEQRGRATVLARRWGEGELALALAAGPALDLGVELGAAAARLDLTGLSIRRLSVSSGASDVRLDFGTPNPTNMEELSVQAGAAGVTIHRLGNARVQRVRVRCGVGGVDLDLGGAWDADMELRLDVAVGGATLRIPRGVGVRMRVSKVLASLDMPGFVRRDDAYVSDNWDSAARKLTIEAAATLGSLEVQWIDR